EPLNDVGPGAGAALCEEALQQTGHWPAMIGMDYADYSQGKDRLHTATVNRVALNYARQGSLVRVSAYVPNRQISRMVDFVTMVSISRPSFPRPHYEGRPFGSFLWKLSRSRELLVD